MLLSSSIRKSEIIRCVVNESFYVNNKRSRYVHFACTKNWRSSRSPWALTPGYNYSCSRDARVACERNWRRSRFPNVNALIQPYMIDGRPYSIYMKIWRCFDCVPFMTVCMVRLQFSICSKKRWMTWKMRDISFPSQPGHYLWEFSESRKLMK